MAKITKTLGPIHFEDLEPHRFEDLVRELIYDYKDWLDIEATGRGGSDNGFDVRAWERVNEVVEKAENDDDTEPEIEPSTPTEGNLWMIQCKREKEIGPTKVAEIIKGIDEKNPPYGYILVASTDFSKKSHDVFREELRKKGVMEFHLWGKAALEDMLHMPKNDRILFTYFGVSLVARRRTRRTEIRFAMNNKNKLLKVLGGGEHDRQMHESVLIRDVEDEKYPFKQDYKDFDKKPRWREAIATSFHPLGLIINNRRFFAYVDWDKKEFDVVDSDDLIHRQSEMDEDREKGKFAKRQLIEDFWKHLPRKNQAHFTVDVLLLFEDMIVIDDKGDSANKFPHIYCEYKYDGKPWRGIWQCIEVSDQQYDVKTNKFKKIDFFPKDFPEIKKGKVHADQFIETDEDPTRMIRNGHVKTLYGVDGKYDFLEVRDKIRVKGTETTSSYNRESEPMKGIEVMYKYETTLKERMEKIGPHIKSDISRQAGRELKDDDKITVIEVEPAYHWEFPDIQQKEG